MGNGASDPSLAAAIAVTLVLACGPARSEVPVPSAAAPRPVPASTPTPAAGEARFSFDAATSGGVPSGFTAVLSGQGAPGRWEVLETADALSGGRVVAQLDGDATGYRFPLLVLDGVDARDVEVAVSGRPVAGAKDQAFGLVWRYRDPEHYYVVRANALEDNVVVYKMEGGKRSDLDVRGAGRTYGVDVEVPGGAWSRLALRAVGSLFTVFLDGRPLFEVEDDTFRDAGKVGLWTKADSVTWFDDLEVRVLDGEGSP